MINTNRGTADILRAIKEKVNAARESELKETATTFTLPNIADPIIPVTEKDKGQTNEKFEHDILNDNSMVVFISPIFSQGDSIYALPTDEQPRAIIETRISFSTRVIDNKNLTDSEFTIYYQFENKENDKSIIITEKKILSDTRNINEKVNDRILRRFWLKSTNCHPYTSDKSFVENYKNINLSLSRLQRFVKKLFKI